MTLNAHKYDYYNPRVNGQINKLLYYIDNNKHEGNIFSSNRASRQTVLLSGISLSM